MQKSKSVAAKTKTSKGSKKSKGQTKAQRNANLEKARAARGTSPFAKLSLKELEAKKAKSTDTREQAIIRRYIRAARRAAGMPIPSEVKANGKAKAKTTGKDKKAVAKGKPASKKSKRAVEEDEDGDDDEDF